MPEKVVVPTHMFACLDAEGEDYVVEAELRARNNTVVIRLHVMSLLQKQEEIYGTIHITHCFWKVL